MNGTITTQESKDGPRKPDTETQPIRRPHSPVRKLFKHKLGRRTRSLGRQQDQGQHDGEKSQNMQNQHHPLKLGQQAPEGAVDHKGKQNHGPVQAGGGGHDRGGSADGHDDQDRRHDGGARLGARGVFEDGHEGVARVGGQGGLDVAQAVDEGQEHAEAERAVDEEAGHDGPGDDDFRVADFFGHLGEPRVSMTDR